MDGRVEGAFGFRRRSCLLGLQTHFPSPRDLVVGSAKLPVKGVRTHSDAKVGVAGPAEKACEARTQVWPLLAGHQLQAYKPEAVPLPVPQQEPRWVEYLRVWDLTDLAGCSSNGEGLMAPRALPRVWTRKTLLILIVENQGHEMDY